VEIVEWEGAVLGVNVGHPIVTDGILCVRDGDAALPKLLWDFLLKIVQTPHVFGRHADHVPLFLVSARDMQMINAVNTAHHYCNCHCLPHPHSCSFNSSTTIPIVIPPPGRVAKYCDEYVCLSVCPLA